MRRSGDAAELAASFAERMDPTRSYGEGAFGILKAIGEGQPWSQASRNAFRGKGSLATARPCVAPPLPLVTP